MAATKETQKLDEAENVELLPNSNEVLSADHSELKRLLDLAENSEVPLSQRLTAYHSALKIALAYLGFDLVG